MECAWLETGDRSQWESCAIYPVSRPAQSDAGTGDIMSPPLSEEVSFLVYLGGSDGSLLLLRLSAKLNADGVSRTTTSTVLARRALTAAGVRAQRDPLADGEGPVDVTAVAGSPSGVTFIHVDVGWQEPRVVALCGGKLFLLHHTTLEVRPAFQGLVGLGKITACAADGEPECRNRHRLAAVVGCHLVCIEYTDTGCTVMDFTGFERRVVASEVHHRTGRREETVLSIGTLSEFVDHRSLDFSLSTALLDVASSHPVAAADVDDVVPTEGSGPRLSASALTPPPHQHGSPASLLSLPEGVTQLLWHGKVVIAGARQQYSVHDVRTQQLMDLLEVSESAPLGPLLRHAGCAGASGVDLVLLRLGKQLVLYDLASEAGLDSAVPVEFSEPVVDAAYCYPFFVGIKPDGKVLLRSCIDKEEFPLPPSFAGFGAMPTALAVSASGLIAAGPHGADALMVSPPGAQVLALVHAHQYARAVAHLDATIGDSSGAECDRAHQRVYGLCARHAWGRRHFKEAIYYFALAGTPTTALVHLVPELRMCDPATIDKDRIPVSLTSGEAFRALYDLLVMRRSAECTAPEADGPAPHTGRRDRGAPWEALPRPGDGGSAPGASAAGKAGTPSRGADGPADQQVHEGLAERRATEFALFMLFVLDRVAYTERDLAEHFLSSVAVSPHDYLALIGEGGPFPRPRIAPLAMARAGFHAEALRQCRRMGMVYVATVALQLSGDATLYSEHLPWMLQANPSEALRCVCTPQWRPPPAATILPLLLGYGGAPLHEYLHYVVYEEGSVDGTIHTTYALNLLSMIKELHAYGLEGFTAAELRLPPGDETGVLGQTRRALLAFLRESDWYDGDVVLANLKRMDLKEEQVIVHAKVGDHVGALSILVYELDSVSEAILYCVHQHRGTYFVASNPSAGPQHGPSAAIAAAAAAAASLRGGPVESPGDLPLGWDACPTPQGGDAAHLLTQREDDVLVLPTQATYTEANLGSQARQKREKRFNDYFNLLLYVLLVPIEGHSQRLSAALDLLRDQSRSINPHSVMESLPGEVCVAEISSYLVRTFQSLKHDVHLAAVCAQNTLSVAAAVERYHSVLRQRCVYMTDGRPCVVCERPLEDSLFAIFPNLSVAHFRCFKERGLDPTRGVPFRTLLQ